VSATPHIGCSTRRRRERPVDRAPGVASIPVRPGPSSLADDVARIVWAAVGMGIEHLPEGRIAFALAAGVDADELRRELMVPESWNRAMVDAHAELGRMRMAIRRRPRGRSPEDGAVVTH
jgi:hypothetical protein